MTLLDGKKLASKLNIEIASKVSDLKNKTKISPKLAAILIGEDPASAIYVETKKRACLHVGIEFLLIKYKDIEEEKLINLIKDLNKDTTISGIIVQLPLPKHIYSQKIMEIISPEKDVDGFNSVSYGKMLKGLNAHIPATALGIISMIKHYKINTQGAHCVIIGRSFSVGLPLALLMSRNHYPGNATVSICHKSTKNLQSLTLQADILIAAAGRAKLVNDSMVKPGVSVIDVGITRIQDPHHNSKNYLQGDVDFDKVAPKCSFITPVPGGVGPMTVSSLMYNTLKAATINICDEDFTIEGFC